MKIIFGILDEVAHLIPWIVVAWILFGSVAIATAQELTQGQKTVAMTILGEARGEGKQGMYAVACVIKRRVQLKRWPNTALKVCLEKSQFDYWTQHSKAKWDDINRATVRRLMKHDIETVRYAKMLALNIDKMDLNWSRHADHYCTIATTVNWTQGAKPVLIIKNHKFYKLQK